MSLPETLSNIEKWLDMAIATETAQIDRLTHNKRVFQRIQKVRHEREELRDTIQKLEIEEERQRRFRPTHSTANTAGTTQNPSKKPSSKSNVDSGDISTGPSTVMSLASYVATNSSQPQQESNEDMSKLLPKQLDSILALAQNTREGRIGRLGAVSNATTSVTTNSKQPPNSTTTNSNSKTASAAGKELSEMHAKYKLMIPHGLSAPSQSSAAKAAASLPTPPPPAASASASAGISAKHDKPTTPREHSSSTSAERSAPIANPVVPSTELEAAREQLVSSPRFQALHAFEEQISHLNRVRIYNKIRYPTIKATQTERLHQSQLQILQRCPPKTHQPRLFAWQGEGGSDLVISLLSMSSFAQRQRLRNRMQQLVNLIHKGLQQSESKTKTMVIGLVQQEVRRVQLMHQQLKTTKRVAPSQAQDFLAVCVLLQYWQSVLLSITGNADTDFQGHILNLRHNNEDISAVDTQQHVHNYWRSEIDLVQNAWMHVLDRLDFGLTDVPVTKTAGKDSKDREKDTNKESMAGLLHLDNVLLHYAASMQIQVASLVKYRVLSSFLRTSKLCGLPLDLYERRLLRIAAAMWNGAEEGQDERPRVLLARTRTTLRSELDWIEYLKKIKLTHAIVAHDAATLSTCVFVRK